MIRIRKLGSSVLPPDDPHYVHLWRDEMLVPGPTLQLPGTITPVQSILENRGGRDYPGGSQEINVITMQRRPIGQEFWLNAEAVSAKPRYSEMEDKKETAQEARETLETIPIDAYDLTQKSEEPKSWFSISSFLFGTAVGIAGTFLLGTILVYSLERQKRMPSRTSAAIYAPAEKGK